MTYATVMASLRLYEPNDGCLAIAGDLAERFEAYAIGVAASTFSPSPYFTMGSAAQRLLDEADAAIGRRFTELEGQFNAAMKPRARQVEWRCAKELPAEYVAQQSRAADIVVCGRSERQLSDPFGQTDPDDLIMRVGRPLLVAPPSVRGLDLSSCLVAWKDSPEARRAVAEALPLLRQAKQVTVAEIVEPGGSPAAALARVHDVAAWLGRHGIAATGSVPETAGNPAEQLDRIAAKTGAGLIVAGAYGHSRFREWTLGGVTRHLLEQSERCALLAR